jgi:hypothetical protein
MRPKLRGSVLEMGQVGSTGDGVGEELGQVRLKEILEALLASSCDR